MTELQLSITGSHKLVHGTSSTGRGIFLSTGYAKFKPDGVGQDESEFYIS